MMRRLALRSSGYNKTTSKPVITYEPDRDPNDGTKVRREEYGKGKKGSRVVDLHARLPRYYTASRAYHIHGPTIVGSAIGFRGKEEALVSSSVLGCFRCLGGLSRSPGELTGRGR